MDQNVQDFKKTQQYFEFIILFSIKYLKAALLYTLLGTSFFHMLGNMSIQCSLFIFTQVSPFSWR